MGTLSDGDDRFVSILPRSSEEQVNSSYTYAHVMLHHDLAPPTPIRGVLFDLHSTLIDQGEARAWLDLALDRAPHELSDADRDALLDWLDRIWEGARISDPDSLRDLSPEDHYRVFHELLANGPGVDVALGDALHATLLDTWHAYADTVPTLTSLREAGIRIAVISNVGLDVIEVLEREGLAALADAVVLSKDVGSVKPDAGIFAAALQALGCAPHEALMVGDSGKDDVGGTVLGMRTLILPRTRGAVHGLEAVVDLVLATQRYGRQA